MPIRYGTTRSGRATRNSVAAPEPTKITRAELRQARRNTKTAIRSKLRKTADSQDCIVVCSDSESDSDSDIKSEVDSDSDFEVVPEPSKPRARAQPKPKKTAPPAEPVTKGRVLATVPLTTDKRVTHIPLNDMTPFVNRPATVRIEEQAAKKTSGKALNGFFVYKMAYHSRIRHIQKILNAKTPKGVRQLNGYNAIAAQSWRLEDDSVRQFYFNLAKKDEENRAKAFADCPEMIRRKRDDSHEVEDSETPVTYPNMYPKKRQTPMSEMQKPLPVGVTPAAAAEGNESPVEAEVAAPFASMEPSPSLIFPFPTVATVSVPAVTADPFVANFTGFYNPAEEKEAHERFIQLPKKTVYTDMATDNSTVIVPVEEMSHLALDDHERDDVDMDAKFDFDFDMDFDVNMQGSIYNMYPEIGSFCEDLADMDVDFAEAMANYEAVMGSH